jgi:hypothetical protein
MWFISSMWARGGGGGHVHTCAVVDYHVEPQGRCSCGLPPSPPLLLPFFLLLLSGALHGLGDGDAVRYHPVGSPDQAFEGRRGIR